MQTYALADALKVRACQDPFVLELATSTEACIQIPADRFCGFPSASKSQYHQRKSWMLRSKGLKVRHAQGY